MNAMMNSVLLVCAVMASLAAGVLAAYGLCLGMFGVFRVQSQAAAQQRATRALRIALD